MGKIEDYSGGNLESPYQSYIRTLIQDISKKWELHSCLYSLHRSKVEPFEDFDNVTLDNLTTENFNEYVITIPNML